MPQAGAWLKILLCKINKYISLYERWVPRMSTGLHCPQKALRERTAPITDNISPNKPAMILHTTLSCPAPIQAASRGGKGIKMKMKNTSSQIVGD